MEDQCLLAGLNLAKLSEQKADVRLKHKASNILFLLPLQIMQNLLTRILDSKDQEYHMIFSIKHSALHNVPKGHVFNQLANPLRDLIKII